MSVVFDKLSFVKRLEDAGSFTRPQAEALSDAFHQAVAETVATKQDLERATTNIQHEIALVRAELRSEMGQLRSESKHDNELLRRDMTAGFAEQAAKTAETRVWSIGLTGTAVAILAAIKYFG